MPQSSIAAWLQRTRGSTEVETVLDADHLKSNSANDAQNPKLGLAPGTQHLSSSSTPVANQRLQGPALHRNACMRLCKEAHIASFHRLNTLLLPIPYPQSFYDETLNDPVISSLTRIITWGHTAVDQKSNISRDGPNCTQDTQDGQLVAAVRCRLLPASPSRNDEETVVYISTVGVLAPFRRHMLASHLLSEVAQVAVEQHGARSMMAHVWEKNEEAIQWYGNRGFEIVRKEKDYYRRLAPDTAAFLMMREISRLDVLTWPVPTADG